MDVVPLGFAVFDEHRGDALGNFSFLIRTTSLDPSDLHMRHDLPPWFLLFELSLSPESARILSGAGLPGKPAAPCARINYPCIRRFRTSSSFSASTTKLPR